MGKFKKPDYVVVDRNVAHAFMHNSTHMEYDYIEPLYLDIKVKLRNGLGELTMGEILKRTKERVDRLAEYFRCALEEQEGPE